MLRLLRSVLNTAVDDDELIRRNPCRIKGAGAEASPERPVATPVQVLTLVDAMPERWRALVLLAAAGSFRWSELMGLTRADIDLRRGTVRVQRSVAEVKGKFVVGPPKSRAGRRVVAIPSAVVAALGVHLRRFSEDGPEGRVFVGAKGATMRRTNFQTMWTVGIEAAGLPAGFRFHGLRHTGNTWAAQSGANLRELMERMGHDRERAALIYLHSTDDGDRRIADGIDARLTNDEAAGGDVDQADGE